MDFRINIKNPKNIFLKVFGIYFIIISALSYYQAVFIDDISLIFWFSYLVMLITGIGLIKKKAYLIGSQINIVLIPYLIWNLDFFYELITKTPLLGITSYFFEGRILLAQIITLQHVVIIPISFIAFYLIKFERKDFWKISLIQGVIIYNLTVFFSNPKMNINCVFQNCLPFYVPQIIYPFFWFFCFIVMVGIVNYILIKIPVFNSKNERNEQKISPRKNYSSKSNIITKLKKYIKLNKPKNLIR